MVDEIRFKTDMQQAIANKGKEYSTIYKDLIFYENSKVYLKTLFFMKELNIDIIENQLNFNIKIDEDKIKIISENGLKAIKLANDKLNIQELIYQKIKNDLLEENNFSAEELVEADELINGKYEMEEKEEKPCRKPTAEDFERIEKMQEKIQKIFKIIVKPKLNDPFLSVELNIKSLHLNAENIRLFFELANITDIISITPNFEEDDNTIKGIKIFCGVDLSI